MRLELLFVRGDECDCSFRCRHQKRVFLQVDAYISQLTVDHGFQLWDFEFRSLSSELLMCVGGVRSILLFPLVARCLETIDVCIWRMFVFMSVVVTVWGSVVIFVV